MALATASEICADIILLCEPNKNAIKHRNDWIKDRNLDTAIKLVSRTTIKGQGHGHGFTFVRTNTITAFSCYASPNKDIDDLERVLHEIGALLHCFKEKIVIAGDFNAKSAQWGMRVNDRRGQLLMEWMAEHDLICCNKGNKPTFQRNQSTSILDLTMTTENVRISQWEVSDKETLSDHNYIIFSIEENTRRPQAKSLENHGWQIKKLNREKLQQCITNINEPTTVSVPDLRDNLKKLCNASMPRRRNIAGKVPAYWWTDEIAKLRKECVATRRQYTRSNKRECPVETEYFRSKYNDCKKKLRNQIKASKRNRWREICDSVDQDLWGDGYKIAVKRMKGFQPGLQLPLEKVIEIASHLFPEHEPVTFICDRGEVFLDFTNEELRIASAKLKNKKAPGPGGIPAEILKELALHKPNYLLTVYNDLAKHGKFPQEWKKAKLVLLKKGNKPMENASSYRPICLLDSEGKLFEQLLLIRLKNELVKCRNLAERQFGFREGIQTADAISEVLKRVSEAEDFSIPHRRLCAVITLDIKNAFNSASCQIILESLRNKGINEGLITVIASYLSERELIIEAEGITKMKKISSGVPQGSVLGPTLWNVLYDEILRIEMPEGVTTIGFADDIALVVVEKDERILVNKANTGLQQVSNWLESRSLKLAPEKTEAVIITKKRKVSPMTFLIEGVQIVPIKAIKYLGVWLDSKLSFAEHVNQIIQKVGKTISALSCIMPNVGGPRASKRRIMASVIHSQILYASPVWQRVITNKNLSRRLASLQRLACLRVSSAYRTVSSDAVGVITGIPPIDLLVKERAQIYNGAAKQTARDELLTSWQERWTNGTTGRWTFKLIPVIKTWIERPLGEVDYFITQALTGHGCFNKYLFQRNRADHETCVYCGSIDDAEHTLFICPRWQNARNEYSATTNRTFDIDAMMTDLTTGPSWQHSYNVVRKIMQNKELDRRNT